MGRLWCEHLPVVRAPQGADPKRLTIITPFYENHEFLKLQIGWWRTFPAWLRAQLSAIIVDDGSPVPARLPSDLPFPVRLFRIHQDIRWNWLAARNIGFHHAPEGWCLVTDIDHVIPQSTATSVVYGQHDPEKVYAFSRIEHNGTPVSPHSASFLMTRQMFWRIGGYDETLSGHYGTDGEYRRRLAAVAPMAILEDRLIRHEYQGDSSTTTYQRKQPEDAGVKALIAQRGKGWKPRTLSFPYSEVATMATAPTPSPLAPLPTTPTAPSTGPRPSPLPTQAPTVPTVPTSTGA